MRTFILIILLFAFGNSWSQDLPDSLSKYSYLIQTKKTGDPLQATGFFARYEDRLFFITAAHCLTGWDPFSFKQIQDFPDTVFIRISNDTGKLQYLPLPLRDIKRSARPFHEYEAPNVYVVEIRDPEKYPVYSVEEFFEGTLQCNKPREIYVFGYPTAVGYNDYLRDRQQALSSTATFGQEYGISAFRPEKKVYDPVNYYASITKGFGPGLSGAPAYLLTEDFQLVFGGLYIGSASNSREMGMVVRPEYVIDKIIAKIKGR